MRKFLPFILLLLLARPAQAGSVQFSTYDPAPFGMYDRLRLVPRASLAGPACDPGTFYYETGAGLKLCDESAAWGPLGSGVWTQDSVNNYIYPADTATNPNLKVGIGTTTPRTRLELGTDGAILATGTYGSGWTEPNLGGGTRLLWYPRKGAFRAGYVNGTQWDDAYIGDYSVAMGANTWARGLASTAMGANTAANGLNSTAIGAGAIANGVASTAMGGYTIADAFGSFVLGQYNVQSGDSMLWVPTDPLFVIGNGTNSGSLSNAMTVLKNGNVGIGTTTPNNKLQVAGLVNFDDTLLSTSLGYQAGNANTGIDNTFVGYQSGLPNTGANNTASGSRALRFNTTGTSNTASGAWALYSNSTGSFNTASGSWALRFNTTGANNTASGWRALDNNSTGNSNTASGSGALSANTTGSYNTAYGTEALYSNTTGDYNTTSGFRALRSNTTGICNTASGYSALYSNTLGNYNTANGHNALISNTTGSNNTASGTYALIANSTGNSNTANGYSALSTNTTGYENTASGYDALFYNTTGFQNTASGSQALLSNTTGTNNTASGTSALAANTTGNKNIAVGSGAGHNITTGSRNIIIGANIDAPSATADNQLSIGNLIFGTGLDGTGTTVSTGNIGIGTNSPQSRLQVNGYIQLATIQGGSPPAADCDSAGETGRMEFDAANNLLYICGNAGWIIK
ncbi:MAG: hypothetical protein HZA29_01740 [Candidatus Omnitrophica bacterium]|nr:hypothetical protein [Candidatus Omnitrophota bacterium]